jgi:hypothetical protein
MDQVETPPAHMVRRELAQLEVALLEALILHDMDTFERRLADEFTLTTGRSGAEVRTRGEWMRVTREEYVLEAFSIDEIVVQPYGDVAVVRLRYRQAGRMGDRERTGIYRMTDVFVRRDGVWQLVTRHASQIEQY